MRWRLAVLAIAAFLGGSAALAQPATDDVVVCTNVSAGRDDRIAACTRLIDDSARAAEERSAYLVERAWALRADDRPDDAIADFTAALELWPGNVEALAGRGYVHYREGRNELSLADYAAAAALAPDDGYRRYELGMAHLRLNATADALAEFDAALALRPDYASALYARGWTRLRGGDYEGALPDFVRLNELYPLDADYREGLGWAYYRLGDTAEAIRALAVAVLLDPNLGDAQFLLDELAPASPADATGPLSYHAPPEGLRVTYVEVIGETVPAVDEVEAAIRALVAFFATETEYPVPDVIRGAERVFGATTDGLTMITTSPFLGDEPPETTLPRLLGLWPTILAEGGPPVTISYDGLDAFWKMRPGESTTATGQLLFACPERVNPLGVLLGCTAGVTASTVGSLTLRAHFDGWENVVVPAGQRLAARVSFTETRQLSLAGQTQTTSVEGVWWIDPELGFWIKRQQSRNGETQTIAAWTIDLPN